MFLKIDQTRKSLTERINEIDKQLMDNQLKIESTFGNVTKARTAQMNDDEAANSILNIRDELNREKKKLKKDLLFIDEETTGGPSPRWAIIAECDDDGTIRSQLTLRDPIAPEKKDSVDKLLRVSLKGLFDMDKVLVSIGRE